MNIMQEIRHQACRETMMSDMRHDFTYEELDKLSDKELFKLWRKYAELQSERRHEQ